MFKRRKGVEKKSKEKKNKTNETIFFPLSAFNTKKNVYV